MMEKPLVSVIIPNYNHARFLKERMDSVLNQTYSNIELIILDDASTDNSADTLREICSDTRIKHLIINERNSGSAFAQWQKGLNLAEGQLIWISESDDFADEQLLQALVEKFQKFDINIAYAQSYDVDEQGNKIFDRMDYTSSLDQDLWKSDFVMEGEVFLKKFFSKKNVIPNVSAVLFEKEALIKVFQSSIPFGSYKKCGDWLVYSLICNQPKTKIAYVSKHLNFFRHSIGNTRTNDSTQSQLIRLCEEWIVRAEFGGRFEWNSAWCVSKQRTIEQSLFELYNTGFKKQIIEKLSSLAHQDSISTFKKAMMRERIRRFLQKLGIKK